MASVKLGFSVWCCTSQVPYHHVALIFVGKIRCSYIEERTKNRILKDKKRYSALYKSHDSFLQLIRQDSLPIFGTDYLFGSLANLNDLYTFLNQYY